MRDKRSWSSLVVPMALLFLGAQFTFAAVQGNHGLFRGIQVEAERAALADELAALRASVAQMEQLTHGLSDDALDPDLLDEMARQVLGRLRPDEIVLH